MNLITQPQAEDIKARIPDFDVPEKREYLVQRLFGANVRQASLVAGVNHTVPKVWADMDPDFARWLGQVTALGRRGLQKEVIEGEFLRTMFRFLKIDAEVLDAYESDPNSLSDNQLKYLEGIRRMYSVEALANLLKVTTGKDEAGTGDLNVGQVNIYVDDQLVRSEQAERVASKSLLGLLKAERAIEGESRLIEEHVDDISAG